MRATEHGLCRAYVISQSASNWGLLSGVQTASCLSVQPPWWIPLIQRCRVLTRWCFACVPTHRPGSRILGIRKRWRSLRSSGLIGSCKTDHWLPRYPASLIAVCTYVSIKRRERTTLHQSKYYPWEAGLPHPMPGSSDTNFPSSRFTLRDDVLTNHNTKRN